MRPWLILISVLSVFGVGCGDAREDETPSEESGELGTLQLSLRGVDERMQSYRLRGATFDIQGYRYTDYQNVSSALSSDVELDSPVARARLVSGQYTVTLRPDTWYLERVSPEGVAERVTRALLLSSTQQFVAIQQGVTSRIAFQFGVDGDMVDFFGGDLEVGIEVRNAPDSGAPIAPL